MCYAPMEVFLSWIKIESWISEKDNYKHFVRIWSFNSCVNSLYHSGEVWSNSNGKHSIYDLVYLIHLNDYWLYLRSRWLNVCWDLFNVSYGVGQNKSLRLSNKLCQYWIHHSVRRLHERIALFFEMKWRNSFWFLCFECLKTNYCSLTSVTVKIPQQTLNFFLSLRDPINKNQTALI